MEKAMAALSVVLCAAIIIIGNVYWTHKYKSDEGKVSAAAGDMQKSNESNKNAIIKETEKLAYTKNLPNDVANKIQKAYVEKKTLKFVIYGSSAIEEKEGSWSKMFKDALIDTYGEDLFDIEIISEGERHSLNVSDDKSYLKVADLKPDLVLFEPFVLKNNGFVLTKDGESVAQTIIAAIEKENKDAIVMVQPSYPIYGTNYYPQHMKSMKKSIESKGHLYFDHWKNWPELSDPELKGYVEKDNSGPNAKGNEVWASYLIDQFISK